MLSLDQIRYAGEARFQRELEKLDRRTRAKVLAALEDYGHPRDIPDEFWREIQREQEELLMAAIILMMRAGDEWTEDALVSQGLSRTGYGPTAYALDAARRAQDSAAISTNTLRNRITRSVEDALASPTGGVGEMSATAARKAVDNVFTPARREAIATTETTGALTYGQRGAADRMGGDGARLDGQRVAIELHWETEQDNRVCPRCSPLQDQPEEVWGKVFPNGPGEESHPNCRCWLNPVVVVTRELVAAESFRESEEEGGRWVTMNGNAVFIKDGESAEDALARDIGGRARDRQERFALEDYTTDKFQQINSALRSGSLGGEYVDLIKNIDSALAKSPKRYGTTARSFDLPDGPEGERIASMLQPGKEFSDAAYLSTRKNPTLSDKFAVNNKMPIKGHVVLKITGKSGVDISGISLNPGEGEVLYPRGTKFKVHRAIHANGGVIATLEEL